MFDINAISNCWKKCTVVNFFMQDQLSRAYSIQMDIVSDHKITNCAGKQVVVKVENKHKNCQYSFVRSGIITEWMDFHAPNSLEYFIYRYEIRPLFWHASQRKKYVIFQDKTISQIIKESLSHISKLTVEIKIQKDEKLKICVQYAETVYDFILRLTAYHGIFFYFKNSNKETIVFTDSMSSLEEFKMNNSSKIHANLFHYFNSCFTNIELGNQIIGYDYGNPKTSIQHSSKGNNLEEIYDENVLNDEEAQKLSNNFDASLKCRSIQYKCNTALPIYAGALFFMNEHSCKQLNQKYYVESVTHSMSRVSFNHFLNNSEFQTKFKTEINQLHNYNRSQYAVSANLMLEKNVFKPKLLPSPQIIGLQSAVVVGPKDQKDRKVYTDEFGRVKVRFRWNIHAKKDEHDIFAWIRVAQWGGAGKSWGYGYIPRIGQEVLVSFENGNSNLPIIIGCLYNGYDTYVYDTKKEAHKIGLRTQSVKTKDGFHELVFDDETDEAFMRIEGTKTVNIERGSYKMTIKRGNYEKMLLAEDEPVDGKGDDILKLKKGSREIEIEEGNHYTKLKKGDVSMKIDEGNSVIEISKGHQKVTLNEGNIELLVKNGKYTINLNSGSLEIKTSDSVKVQCKDFSVSASSSIALSGGKVKISGSSVNVSAENTANLKGMTVNVDGTTTNVKGNMVNIN